MPKILVIGSGFVGQAVCRRAVDLGLEIISLSKSGRPHLQPWTNSV